MATLLEADKLFYTPYEPKLKNRYIFEIGGIPAFTIKTAQRPQITFDEVTLEHMNITKYVKVFLTANNCETCPLHSVPKSAGNVVLYFSCSDVIGGRL